ncbi:MAG TPA: ABC transporter permease, partial [Pilimelia sp.]|nr:ABC transporter permease [Pilimelia sp.]
MNLLRAELGRLTARRFVRLMVVLLVVAGGLAMATTVASSSPPDAQRVAAAARQAAEERANAARFLAECRAARAPGAPQSLREKYPPCERIDVNQPVTEDFLYGVFVFDRQIKVLLLVLAAFLALFGFLVGASYVGAELASGGMTNLLLWRPRRGRVLGTKLAAVTGGVFVASVLATLLYVGGFWLIGQTVGLPGRVTAHEWGAHGLLALRGIGVAVVATVVGFCVATLGRH